MTLKEFIIDTFAANYIDFTDSKVEEMERKIEEYARKKAEGSRCVAISDDEVKRYILDSKEMMEKLEEEKAKRKEELKAQRLQEQEQRRKEKAEEDMKPYQLELF